MSLPHLPIDAVLPPLLAALRTSPSVVLRAPTGAGKTTRVPPAMLDAPGFIGQIVLLEPRRLAARAAARRMAFERGGRLGDDIGYHVRFDRQAGPRTRVLVVTPGILLRLLHDDPYLEAVGTVIFDEFHERGLDSDLALGMVRLIQQTVRPELRMVVMSATLAVEAVAGYLGGCPIVVSEGRLHPVAIVHEPRAEAQPWPQAAADAAQRLLDRTPGDILVFLPGMREIQQTARHLEATATARGLAVLPLHGDLPPERQDAALLPQSRRKVVLATNVAETSVTVEGVTGVVDTGLARVLTYDASVGLDRLRLTPISRSSADQRAGRAGRTQPGICVRLWSPASPRSRPEQTDPEIRRVDLAGAVLHLLALGEKDVRRFPWIETPPEATVLRAFELLQRLGAVADDAITDLGRELARLPTHPRLARLLVEGQRWGRLDRAALTAALLAERDPFSRTAGEPMPQRPHHATVSDILDRVEALEDFERTGRSATPFGTLHRSAAHFLFQARDQLRRSLRPTNNQGDVEEAVLRALLSAYPDRLARRRQPGSDRGVMVGGRGVRIAPGSRVTEAELFLCIDVDAGQGETFVRQASAVRREWLAEEHLTTAVDVAFDEASEKVTATRRVRFLDLVLEEASASLPRDGTVEVALSKSVGENLARVLPPADSPAMAYLTRVRCVLAWLPESRLPSMEANDLRELLTWLCHGKRSFAELRGADWLGAIQSRLTYEQRQLIDREAPERWQVPSGSAIGLHYEEGRPPVLAVRIQEMFGLTETPRVAGGRVPVLLHLLAPNYRPQQVTDDLASFWANTYPLIRKELRARYPKHAWPEDPLTAPPQRGPRRRS